MVNDQREAQIPFIYIFLFITLYMFRTHRTYHQERQIVSIQPLGVNSQPAHNTATNIE